MNRKPFISLFLAVVLMLGFGTLVVAQDATPPADAKAPAADAKPADAKPADAKPADTKPADFKEEIPMENCGKAGKVVFGHGAHNKTNACAVCHAGDAPLFQQKRSEAGMKMADMYAGKTCGACHDGKKAFAAKTSCAKCHKKG